MVTNKGFASFCEKGAVLSEHLPVKKALNYFRQSSDQAQKVLL